MARPHVSVATICFDGFGDKDFVPAFTYAPELGIHGADSMRSFRC